MDASPSVDVALMSGRTGEVLTSDPDSTVVWGEHDYAWFHVPGCQGGSDAYFATLKDIDLEHWDEVLKHHSRAQSQRDLVRSCLANGRFWVFRRSAGQPGLINFAYGIIAASLAELTGGFVFSDNSAWDYERFPATPEEFYTWYFTPSMALHSDFADWAQRCLDSITPIDGAPN